MRFICHAKILASKLVARIVFINSEGSKNPIPKSTSAMTRSTSLIEVGDAPDDKVVEYLKNKGMKGEDVQKLVEFFGGRLVYLDSCAIIAFHRKWT